MATPTNVHYTRATSGPIAGGRTVFAAHAAAQAGAGGAMAHGVPLAAGAAGQAGASAAVAHVVPLAAAAAAAGAATGNLSASGGNSITQFSLGFDAQTPEQISINCPVTSAIGASGKVAVEYKATGSGTWLQAHPLLRIHPEWVDAGAPVTPVDAFAGSIFDLAPGTTYDIRLTLTESGQPDKTLTGTRATRALPAAAGTSNKTLTTAGNLQTTLNGLVPGDVLQLADGTYTVSGLTLDVSGSSGSPIFIRGATRAGVIIKDTTGTVWTIENASHVVIENLTIEGSSTDSGQTASSQGIAFWNGATQQNVTVRTVDFRGVDKGIVASGPVLGALVYDCDMTGNNLWNSTFLASNGSTTWNDDGIRLPGEGNCAWNNTLRGFGDSFAVNAGDFSAAVYFWRNRVEFTGDDSFEADYGTRNIGFYDNYITNAGTLLSCDPVYGGPVYCHRNVCINTFRGPYKFNSENSGHLIYNNTVLRTEGSTGWGWVQFNNGAQENWSYRNNLLVYRGTGDLLAIESTGTRFDFDYNAHYPDRDVWWSNTGVNYTTMTLAIAGSSQTAHTPVFGVSTRRHEHDVVTVSNPWTETVTLGSDHITQFTAQPAMTISGGDAAKNSGIAIPGITDGFSGAAPDRGAVIAGRAAVSYGVTTSRSLPTWRQGQAIGEWRQLPSSAAMDLAAVSPEPSPRGSTGQQSKVYAYVSMVVDEENSDIYSVANGGHDDYSGNEGQRLPLNQNSPAWVTVRPPTLATAVNVTHYSDGRPTARHTYYGKVFDPEARRIILIGGARYGNGARLDTMDALDLETGDYVPAGDYSSFTGTVFNTITVQEHYPVQRDRRNGNIYLFGSGAVAKWTKASNTWAVVLAAGAGGNVAHGDYLCASGWDSTRNRVVIFAGTGAYYSPDSNTMTAITWSGARGGDIGDTNEDGAIYCPATDKFYLRNGGSGGGVIQIDAATFECTTFSTTGGSSIPSIAHAFQKFLHVPALGGAVDVREWNAPPWFLRLY